MGIGRLVDDDTDIVYEMVNPLVGTGASLKKKCITHVHPIAARFQKLVGSHLAEYRSSMLPRTESEQTFREHMIKWYLQEVLTHLLTSHSRNLGKPFDTEFSFTNVETSRSEHWKTHFVPLGDNRVGWIAQDITIQKELELMLRKEGEQLEKAVQERTRDLEVALEVKSRFLAIMSHEVRHLAFFPSFHS